MAPRPKRLKSGVSKKAREGKADGTENTKRKRGRSRKEQIQREGTETTKRKRGPSRKEQIQREAVKEVRQERRTVVRPYTPEEKRRAIERFMIRRARRPANTVRTPKHTARSEYAKQRARVGGRFVGKDYPLPSVTAPKDTFDSNTNVCATGRFCAHSSVLATSPLSRFRVPPVDFVSVSV
jgi:hypothetical protein